MRRAGAEAEGESLAQVGIGGDVGWRWLAGLGTTLNMWFSSIHCEACS
jgi:hypothetical protein